LSYVLTFPLPLYRVSCFLSLSSCICIFFLIHNICCARFFRRHLSCHSRRSSVGKQKRFPCKMVLRMLSFLCGSSLYSHSLFPLLQLPFVFVLNLYLMYVFSVSYRTLSLADIASLPVARLAHPGGCLVAIWITNNPAVRAAVCDEYFPSWGVQYLTTWYWLKVCVGCPSFAPYRM